MEADGLVTRTVYPEVPPRVEYTLSEVGETMRPIINAMAEWGENYKEKHANFQIEYVKGRPAKAGLPFTCAKTSIV